MTSATVTGLPNCAKFQDFKNMIKEGMESGTGVEW